MIMNFRFLIYITTYSGRFCQGHHFVTSGLKDRHIFVRKSCITNHLNFFFQTSSGSLMVSVWRAIPSAINNVRADLF
jgi:hypothetical protein